MSPCRDKVDDPKHRGPTNRQTSHTFRTSPSDCMARRRTTWRVRLPLTIRQQLLPKRVRIKRRIPLQTTWRDRSRGLPLESPLFQHPHMMTSRSFALEPLGGSTQKVRSRGRQRMSAVATSDDICSPIFCCEHHLVSPYLKGLDSQSSLLSISRIQYMADSRSDLMDPVPP